MDNTAHNLLADFIGDCKKALMTDALWASGKYEIHSGFQSVEGNGDRVACEISAYETSTNKPIAVVGMAIDLASSNGSSYTMTLNPDTAAPHNVGRVSLKQGKVIADDQQAYKNAIGLVYSYMTGAISED